MWWLQVVDGTFWLIMLSLKQVDKRRDGVDGQWSSFTVDIGAPNRQTVRLLPAIAANYLAVIHPEGCEEGSYSFLNSSECIDSRGGVFNPDQSSEWVDSGFYFPGLFRDLGYHNVKADFGSDLVSFGIDAPDQVIAILASQKFWLGMFGLSFLPINFSSVNNSQLSFLETLRRNDYIPSRTWSYTAGAHYREYI